MINNNMNRIAVRIANMANPFNVLIIDCSWASLCNAMLLRSTLFIFSIYGCEINWVSLIKAMVIARNNAFRAATNKMFLFLKEFT